MIELTNLIKEFGDLTAVDDISLTVSKGEFFVVLGPNAAGKTTTIKMLVGLLRPSGGAIRVCDHDLRTETRSAHLHLGYVPDEPYLYDKLTGHEFLRFIADMYRIPRDLSQEYIEREIDRFELHEFANELAENYSLGMRQRLVFAAAFLINYYDTGSSVSALNFAHCVASFAVEGRGLTAIPTLKQVENRIRPQKT